MTFTHPVETIAKRLEKALEAVENPVLMSALGKNSQNPDIAIEETEEAFTVKVDLTGVDPDEMALAIWDGVLTLSTVQPEKEDAEDDALAEFESLADEANPDPEGIENYGSLIYQVSLPVNVDLTEVVAEFVEDRLEVQLPKLKAPVPANG